MRRWTLPASAAVLASLLAGLLLPSEYEVQRTWSPAVAPADLHPLLVVADDRARWAPAWLLDTAQVRAAPVERGVWWDVPDLGRGGAKSAVLYDTPAAGSATWLVRARTGRDPIRRWLALRFPGTVGAAMDAALERLETLAPRTTRERDAVTE